MLWKNSTPSPGPVSYTHLLWGPGASVPDITRVETQLWFMFLIGSYVDIGVEAVHLGQVYLIGMNDRGWQTWDSFLKLSLIHI